MTATDMANRITELEQMVEGLRHELAEARSGGAVMRAKDEGAEEMREEMLAMLREQIRSMEALSLDKAALALMGAAASSDTCLHPGEAMVCGTIGVLRVVLDRLGKATLVEAF